MKRSWQWSDETKKSRAVVDALREVLGLGPLYGLARQDSHSWLANISQVRWEMQAGASGKTRRNQTS